MEAQRAAWRRGASRFSRREASKGASVRGASRRRLREGGLCEEGVMSVS